MDTFTTHFFNTRLHIHIQQVNHTEWKEKIERFLQEFTNKWYQSRSEINRLNDLNIGETMVLSEELYDCLQLAHYYFLLTDGYFSYFQTDRGEMVGDAPILFLYHRTVIKVNDCRIDLSEFMQGFLIEKIAKWLKEKVSPQYGKIQGKGMVKTWSVGEKQWDVPIPSPFHQESEIQQLKVTNSAVMTTQKSSSFSNAPLMLNLDIFQATVLTSNLFEAEVIAKLLFYVRTDYLRKWIEQHNIQCICYLVNEDGHTSTLTPTILN